MISKLRMGEEKDVTDLRREVQILHYLTGHKHVTNLIAVWVSAHTHTDTQISGRQ